MHIPGAMAPYVGLQVPQSCVAPQVPLQDTCVPQVLSLPLQD
ncbi:MULTISPECIES: hypothetical protein [Actinoallomurus]|nr:hypothetical protein [Actinoallomurus sp. NBC_01490]